MPQTYFLMKNEKYDQNSFTSIDRYKCVFREASDLTFQVKRLGSTQWDERKRIAYANLYQDNSPPVLSEVTLDLPLHQRNNYFDLRIVSDSPFPVTLSEMYWEGVYNTKYYKRY